MRTRTLIHGDRNDISFVQAGVSASRNSLKTAFIDIDAPGAVCAIERCLQDVCSSCIAGDAHSVKWYTAPEIAQNRNLNFRGCLRSPSRSENKWGWTSCRSRSLARGVSRKSLNTPFIDFDAPGALDETCLRGPQYDERANRSTRLRTQTLFGHDCVQRCRNHASQNCGRRHCSHSQTFTGAHLYFTLTTFQRPASCGTRNFKASGWRDALDLPNAFP